MRPTGRDHRGRRLHRRTDHPGSAQLVQDLEGFGASFGPEAFFDPTCENIGYEARWSPVRDTNQWSLVFDGLPLAATIRSARTIDSGVVASPQNYRLAGDSTFEFGSYNGKAWDSCLTLRYSHRRRPADDREDRSKLHRRRGRRPCRPDRAHRDPRDILLHPPAIRAIVAWPSHDEPSPPGGGSSFRPNGRAKIDCCSPADTHT